MVQMQMFLEPSVSLTCIGQQSEIISCTSYTHISTQSSNTENQVINIIAVI